MSARGNLIVLLWCLLKDKNKSIDSLQKKPNHVLAFASKILLYLYSQCYFFISFWFIKNNVIFNSAIVY